LPTLPNADKIVNDSVDCVRRGEQNRENVLKGTRDIWLRNPAKRPVFDQMLRDAMRRRFDALLVWSMDRRCRSVLHVAQAMIELDAANVALISKQQSIDATGPFGRAMMQMATVFHRTRTLNDQVEGHRGAGSRACRGKDARPSPGCSDDKGCDPTAAWSRAWHPESHQDRALWIGNGAAGEAGDGGDFGFYGIDRRPSGGWPFQKPSRIKKVRPLYKSHGEPCPEGPRCYAYYPLASWPSSSYRLD
jgi:hypothetical protein